MILNEIKDTIQNMVELSNKSLSIDEANQKKDNNNQFSEAVNTIYVSVAKLSEASKKLGFKPQSRNNINDVLEVINILNETISDGEVNPELMRKAKYKISDCTSNLKHEWDWFYNRKSTACEGQLNVISGLMANKEITNKIRSGIFKAKDWDGLAISEQAKNRIELFAESINDIENERKNLKLNPKIESFLKSVGDGRADLFSLSPDVIEWINEKGMENKFLIKFKGE